MKTIKTDCGYLVHKESDEFDIEVYNEDNRLVCALTKKDIKKLITLLNYEGGN